MGTKKLACTPCFLKSAASLGTPRFIPSQVSTSTFKPITRLNESGFGISDFNFGCPHIDYIKRGAICIQGGDRGGSEEPTQAYYKYVEESDAATTKVYA